MKNVLIAIDYNPSARKVAETGFMVAKAMKARITLMHVITDPAYYSSIQYSPVMGYTGLNPADIMNIVDNTTVFQSAQKFLDKSKKHLGDTTIRTLVKEGDFADAIMEAAGETKADLIVMGSHRRSGLEKILVGSVTEKVLHHTNVPLFIIPVQEPGEKSTAKKITRRKTSVKQKVKAK